MVFARIQLPLEQHRITLIRNVNRIARAQRTQLLEQQNRK